MMRGRRFVAPVPEFFGLDDEHLESEFEKALIREFEHFQLELGCDFSFIACQRRLRVGNEWYRVDLLFFHRRLRSLVVIDLKLGEFTHNSRAESKLGESNCGDECDFKSISAFDGG